MTTGVLVAEASGWSAGCDANPSGKSRSGVIRIVTICPESNFERLGPKKPIQASQYFLGIW
jgi:hypothetical protein